MFEFVFRRHMSHPVKEILEPACGTGRLLVEMASHGYEITGYDSSREMVEFANGLIEEAGQSTLASADVGTMQTYTTDAVFDAAINPINSLGYLTSDKDIISHLKNTAAMLQPGGLYVFEIDCAYEGEIEEDTAGWTVEDEGIKVTTVWNVVEQDFENRLSHQCSRMRVESNMCVEEYEDRHTLRLWLLDDLKQLIQQSDGFELIAIYDHKRNSIDLNTRITGEMGNLYYVLRRR